MPHAFISRAISTDGRTVRSSKPSDTSACVRPKAYDSFRKDVQRGGWTEIESEDGIVSVNLDAVVFVKLDTGEHRVGFSGL